MPDHARRTLEVPVYGQVCRTLGLGLHPFLSLLPRAAESPALRRIAADAAKREAVLTEARVCISLLPGYAFIDTRTPCIKLSWLYYKLGAPMDLYLDLLHELTHLRQLAEGADLWDSRFAYVDRATEIEGYAVAFEEGRRLGMTEPELRRHLHNFWMTGSSVTRLRQHIEEFLGSTPSL